MSERNKTLWLGVFIIGGIVITSWLLLFLKPSFGDNRIQLQVYFSNIDKISIGTRVTFGGRPVGEVKSIKAVRDARVGDYTQNGDLYMYALTLLVDSSVSIFTYDEIVFASSGLLGEKSIAIIPRISPPGAPPPREVTNEILYARSTDRLEETLNHIVTVTDSFDNAMKGFTNFLQTNSGDFNSALKSVTTGADTLKLFIEHANESNFIGKTTRTFDDIQTITHQFLNEQGTVSQLLNNNCLYLQATTVLSKLETFLNDVNHYGLLYQFNNNWRRQQRANRYWMKQMECLPVDSDTKK